MEFIFNKIITCIRSRIAESLYLPPERSSHRKNTHLLFYTSAMYLRPLATTFIWHDQTRDFIFTQLNHVLPTMARYRREVFHGKGANSAIEHRFRGKDVDLAIRFSPEWWNFLDTPPDDSSSSHLCDSYTVA